MSLDTSCFQEDYDYPLGDIFPNTITTKESAAECQIFCQATPDCVRFVYAKASVAEAQYRKGCFLKNTPDIQARAKPDNVAGLRTCAGTVCSRIDLVFAQ